MKYAKQLFCLILGGLVFVSCDDHFPDESRDFVIDEEFELKVGQSAFNNSEQISVKFLEVLEDSRCPADVVCVWAGNARINVQMTILEDSETITLNTHPDMNSEPNFTGYTLELVKLEPYPESADHPIAKEKYIARLIMHKK